MHNYTLPQETNVAQAKSLLADSHYIDDDLLILDEINVNSISENALRMQCLFMALCTEGHARYCVDTKEQEVEAGDVMIVSEGQVLSNYMLSPDCRGVALMMSYDFYNDIINEIHELSALFLFSRMHPVFKLNKNEMHDMLGYFSAIRQKVSDTSHHFRREVVITLLKALIYDTSNVIYRPLKRSGPTVPRAFSWPSSSLWKRISGKNGVWDGMPSSCASRPNTSQRPLSTSATALPTTG